MRFKRFLEINEAAYMGNLGVEELFRFYKIATEKQIEMLEMILKKNDWIAFKKLVKKVLGVDLV